MIGITTDTKGSFLVSHRICFILTAASLVFLCNIDALSIKAEDWILLPQFRDLLSQGWKGVIELIVSPRIQFTTYLIEGLLVRGFGLNPLPLFLFLLGAHCISCVLIYRILGKIIGDEDMAVTAALCCLFIPTSASDIFYINHAFFVFPVTMLLALIYLYLFPIRDSWLDLTCLTVVSCVGQFAGEQAVPLFYSVFLMAGIHAYASRQQRLRRAWRAAVPFAVSIASMAWIFFRITMPFLRQVASQSSVRRPTVIVVRQYLMFHLQSLYPQSWMFGRFSEPASLRTWVAMALLAWLLYLFYITGRKGRWTEFLPPRQGAGLLALCCVLCSAIYVIPILLSTISGYRFGAMPKYIYASGLCLAVLLVLACDLAVRRITGGRKAVRRLLFAMMVGYFGFLMQYTVRDVCGTQQEINDKIWRLIDRHYTSQNRFLLLDGMQWNSSLLPNYRSIAYTDFAADGNYVPYRLQVRTGSRPIVVTRRYRTQGGEGGNVELEDKLNHHYVAKPEKILAVVSRYGEKFHDLNDAFIGVFPKFEEYVKFREREPIRFSDNPAAYPLDSW